MTNLKFNVTPFERSLSNLMDGFLTDTPPILKHTLSRPRSGSFAPVNITEKDDLYELEVVAPGFDKENFKIHLDNTLLTISAEKKQEENAENGKSIVQEFLAKSFKRSFTLDEKIDSEKIEAQYVNGILKVTLNKKEASKTTSKDIEIL
jgi:HSP20 family protein